MFSTKTPKMKQLSNGFLIFIIGFFGLFAGPVRAQGTWTQVATPAPDANNGVMLVMTDGSILCHTTSGGNLGDGTIWDRLTPDSTGSYINGTWTQTAGMNQERFSFSSAVLKDGRVYAGGGEYGTDGTQNGWHGEVYNLTTNVWTEIAGSNSTNVISDGSCKLLDNGDVIQALVDVPFPVHTVLFNPTTMAYTAGPSTLGGSNETMWLKLPDNSILFVNEAALTSERYIPASNSWIADGNVPDSLYDPYGYECGPAWMLPNGQAFFIGGTNHTAIYTPSGTTAAGRWRKGPDVPNGYGMPDAPGVMLPNGLILFAASPQPTQQTEFASPTKFFLYNYLDSAYTAIAAPSTASTQSISQQYSLLQLPNGQVLCGLSQDNTSNQYYVYTPTGTPLTAGKPFISDVTRITCTTYMVTGHGFNGISEGSAFGDENECDSNYPLFRFTQGNKVYYARSYNWNSTGVQRGLKPDTAYFELPSAMGSGSYYMYAVANGNASDSILFTDSIPSLSSSLTPPAICSNTAFTYTATSGTPGATLTWTRAAVAGISNAAITTPQTVNPNETLVNTTTNPVTVVYAYSVDGDGCTNAQNVSVVVNPKPTASFTAFPTSGCSVPDSVTFTNTTIAGSTYVWSFGDNGTSSAVNPVHPYTTGGTYSVKLVASSPCGIDSITKANYIAITPPAAPTATSPVSAGCGGTATLTATGADSLKWFTQPTGGTAVGTGPTYVTPALGGSTTYYVENYAASTPVYCPPTSDAFGTGGNYTNNNWRSDVFNVNQPCTLVSVLVVSGAAGNRTIQLQDSLGNVLQTITANIPSGTSTVTLNFPLTVGTEYQLGCGDGATTTNLYRNITGAAFPYTDPSGYITITGNNVPDNVHFYFFYDWKLEGAACVSARTPVTVNISNGLSLSSNVTNVACNGETNGSATVTPSGGTPAYTYTWSNGQTTATLSGVAANTYSVTVHDASGCSGTASEAITQPNALSVSVTPTNATCGATGSAVAAVTGGTSAYNYAWSNGATTATATALAAATYGLTVTDAHSCTASAQVVITSSGNLNVSATETNVACNGAATGTAAVSVTGGSGTISYHWSNGTTTASLTGVVAGTYDVTVSDLGGCSATSSAVITQPTALNVSVTPTNSGCGSPNGSAVASASGGTVGYSYVWSNAATTATITGLSAATYDLTVTDSHQCSVTSSAVITNTGLLNISATPSAANCLGGATGGASVTVNGGTSPFTYNWSNGNTTASISGVAGGAYQITVSDNGGCSGTASVNIVTGVVLSTTGASTGASCFNSTNGAASVTVNSGSSPYVFAWNNGSTGSSISGLAAGNYFVTVTDSRNCVSVDTINVNQPFAITLFVSTNQPTCAGLSDGSAGVSATGGTPGYTYAWSNGSTATHISNLVAGTYSVSLTDANSCSSSASFNITDPAAVTASVVANADSCFGESNGSVQVTAGGGNSPYSYVWSNTSTSATVTGLAAGTYTVTVLDSHNCSTTSSASVNQPTQLTADTSSTAANNGQSNGTATVTPAGGTQPYTVSWSNGGSGQTITGLAGGTYTATVTDLNGCQLTRTVVVQVSVGIANISNDLSFTVYPNPANNYVLVEFTKVNNATVLNIKNVLGQTVITQQVTSQQTQVDLGTLAAGVYTVEVVAGEKTGIRQLVIAR